MRSYFAYIRSTLRLTMRDRLVIFFNYLFPLLIFGGLGEGTGAKVSSGAAAQLYSMVLVLGVLGNGFFGGGMRAVMEREMNILRRFKVAPISAGPIVTASILVGWVLFMPSVFFFWALSKGRYHLAGPESPLSLIVFVSIAAIAFRAMGMILASVVNSMQESQILIQLLYLPMLMLSGATVPLDIMPEWLQSVTMFIPSTHLYLGVQGILIRGETLAQVWEPALALLLTTVLSIFLCMKLFRWEKEERVKGRDKLWVVVALLPFLLAGVWQAHSRSGISRNKVLAREKARAMSWLIRDARLFVGDGTVIENGSLLIRGGRIERLFTGKAPDADELRAEAVEATGKTVMPGLIDGYTLLGFAGGPGQPATGRNVEREMKAYLYSGVVGVRDLTASMPVVQVESARAAVGEIAGPEVFPAPVGARSPLLAFREMMMQLAEGRPDFLSRSLYQQVLPPGEMERLRARVQAAAIPAPPDAREQIPVGPALPGSGGGLSEFAVHGPLLHREMQLWVGSGEPPMKVLQMATAGAAEAVGASGRLGLLKPGFEASLLIVEGNPLEEIAATERIWRVMYKGEIVARAALFEADRKKK
jgi:ABC-type polysaccharide/polyol phosphate export permease